MNNPPPTSTNPLDTIVSAIMQMEGGSMPNSVNQHMVRDYGLWNEGHLTFMGQAGATAVKFPGNNHTWAGWRTREESITAIGNDILAKARVGKTIRLAIEDYAPKFENNTEQYIAWISQAVGYPDSTPLTTVLAGGGAIDPDALTPTPSWSDYLRDITTLDATTLSLMAGAGVVLVLILTKPKS